MRVLVTGARGTRPPVSSAPYGSGTRWSCCRTVPRMPSTQARRVTGGHRGKGCTLGMHTPTRSAQHRGVG